MQQEKNHQSFLGSEYSYLENFFNQFNESDIFLICTKGIKTKKVCWCNPIYAKFFGFSKSSMQGMTTREILSRIPNFINIENELKNFEKHEKKAIQTRQPSVFQHMLLSYDGFVQIRQSLVIPVNGFSRRCIAIAEVARDVTPCIHPSDVLSFYKYYYPKKVRAANKFSAHFNLNVYFYHPLSYEELRTLLVMMQDCRHKQAAEMLGISSKTVANYLFSIRSKLKCDFEIYTILKALRTQSQLKPEVFESKDMGV